jgi:hypothetical protein
MGQMHVLFHLIKKDLHFKCMYGSLIDWRVIVKAIVKLGT